MPHARKMAQATCISLPAYLSPLTYMLGFKAYKEYMLADLHFPKIVERGS